MAPTTASRRPSRRAELVKRPAPARAEKLRQQRGLHGLEQEQRHAGDHQGGQEDARLLLLAGLRQALDREGAGVEQEGGAERGHEQRPHGRQQLAPVGLRALGDEVVLAPQAGEHPEERGERHEGAVRAGHLDADHREHRGEHDPGHALADEQPGVAPEPSLAGQDASREVHGGVAQGPDEEGGEQDLVAAQQLLQLERPEHEGDEPDDGAGGGADGGRLADHGADAEAAGPAVGEGSAHLLLEGQEQAGPGEEDERPHDAERREGLGTEHPPGDGQEGEGHESVDDEATADHEGALGKRVPLARRQVAAEIHGLTTLLGRHRPVTALGRAGLPCSGRSGGRLGDVRHAELVVLGDDDVARGRASRPGTRGRG